MTPPDEIRAELTAQFLRGKAEAREPAPAPAAAGGQFTDLRSPWLALPCPACAHTFRAGDPVQRDGDVVRHHGAGLNCAGGEPAQAVDSADVIAFYAGLDEAVPPPAGLVVTQLPEGHFLTARPVGHFGRRRCLVCAHTFRPNDRVVLCPCRPEAPICQAAAHRDPANGLYCLEAWGPGGEAGDCPVTARRAP